MMEGFNVPAEAISEAVAKIESSNQYGLGNLLKSFAGENYESFTSPNGDSYSNVKSTIIRLNVTITTVQEIIPGFPINITVLTPQDVIVSTQYIASGIGVVHTNTDTSYSINTTIASELGIPASGSQNQKEFLDTYEIN